MKSSLNAVAAAIFAVAAVAPASSYGQAYPSKPIRATIGTPTGGPGDVVLRGAGLAVTNATGQGFVVENRVGVGSILSMEACARGAPDGYTLCSCDQQSLAINPYIRSKLSYPAQDMVPVILPLVVMLENRTPDLPNVPTYKEAGLDVALVTWFGLCAPPRTPRDIVQKLNGIVAKGLLGDPELRAKFVLSQGMVIEGAAGGPPEAFAQHIAAERDRYARIVKITGVRED